MSKQSTLFKHISGVKPLPDQQSTLNFKKKDDGNLKAKEKEEGGPKGDDVQMMDVEDEEEGQFGTTLGLRLGRRRES